MAKDTLKCKVIDFNRLKLSKLQFNKTFRRQGYELQDLVLLEMKMSFTVDSDWLIICFSIIYQITLDIGTQLWLCPRLASEAGYAPATKAGNNWKYWQVEGNERASSLQCCVKN